MPVTVTIKGLEAATEFSSLPTRAKAACFAGVVNALALGLKEARVIVSADDHTLKELAKLGHPYSKEHPQTIHIPDETVHTRRGELLDGLIVNAPSGQAAGIVEGSITNTAQPLDRWIQSGTVRMRPRPYMDRVALDHGDEMADLVVEAIDAALAKPASAQYTGAVLSKYR
jgi:hypothetical protein